jgi:sulfide:quinone oxidoreductase
VRAIVCNRPDGEGSDQPTVAEIRAAAAPLGIAVHYLPVDTGKVTDEQAAQFGVLVASLAGPVLAYCRSGMRSATLWALSQAGSRPIDEIVATAAKAGYDLAAVASRLARGAAQRTGRRRAARHRDRRRGRGRRRGRVEPARATARSTSR